MGEHAVDPDPVPSLAVDNTATIAHINMLQAVVARLAGNSAQCKTWCLTLVTALIALAAAARNIGPVQLAILPIVMFLVLDAAYLGAETSCRRHFDSVVADIGHGRYTSERWFTVRAGVTLCLWLRALRSWSIYIFYYPLIVAWVIVLFFSDFAKVLAGVK